MSQRTVNSDTFTVDFLFSDSTLELESTSLVEMFKNKADVRVENSLDSPGSVRFTFQSGVTPNSSTDDGGLGSTGYWGDGPVGTIDVGSKKLYIYERQS